MARKGKKTLLMKSRDGSIAYTADNNFIYAEKDGVSVRLDLFAGRYYKLRPLKGIPILEIDGLRMQLVRDFKTPLDYADEAVRGLKIPQKGSFTVLDTCMGLGYTAIAAAKKESVKTVVTFEVSPAVIALAKWNPYSDPLFEKGGKIVVMEGSVLDHLKNFESSMFDFAIHDPPRFSLAPELYSPDFYKELYRVCRRGARVFHYTGSVGKSRGRDIGLEVEKRTALSGWRTISRSERLQGIFLTK